MKPVWVTVVARPAVGFLAREVRAEMIVLCATTAAVAPGSARPGPHQQSTPPMPTPGHPPPSWHPPPQRSTPPAMDACTQTDDHARIPPSARPARVLDGSTTCLRIAGTSR